MMHDFLADNRDALIERCRARVGWRPLREATSGQLEKAVPLVLDQLIRTLETKQDFKPAEGLKPPGPDSRGLALPAAKSVTTVQHCAEFLSSGLSVNEIMHGYGDLRQAITDLAIERDVPIQLEEFRALNRCLDYAVAEVVTKLSCQRDAVREREHSLEANKRLGCFAHELRNLLNSATLAFRASEMGSFNISGVTGSVLRRSLEGLNTMIDRTLEEVRAGVHQVNDVVFPLNEFIDEVGIMAQMVAATKHATLLVGEIDPSLAISGDRAFLLLAVGNLLQNAVKFSHPEAELQLAAYAMGDRVLIDVCDQCGGLRAGDSEKMFKPFSQMNADRTGLGLGLSIARRTVECNGGTLTVRDVPGTGCIFTVSLPRRALA